MLMLILIHVFLCPFQWLIIIPQVQSSPSTFSGLKFISFFLHLFLFGTHPNLSGTKANNSRETWVLNSISICFILVYCEPLRVVNLI
ncbi:hypothetical protein RIF29_19302 [Crotalaria pallida]|uniref:Uncharacterized protein n=1 Tax=Crotalaria pallida TaxID=3830 RepID=A0AAN9EZR1_CROPI